MKAFPFFFMMAIAATTLFTLSGCLKDSCEREITYTRIDPVYKSLEEVHAGTAVTVSPLELKNPGQIYYYNNQMFIVERSEGIHVIDNTDPSNPINKSFIEIPGNEDIAIKDGLLYANSFVDLVVIDLNTLNVVGKVENVFQPLWMDITNNRIIVEYKETLVTEKMDCSEQAVLYERDGFFFKGGPAFAGDLAQAANMAGEKAAGSSNVGIAGSLAHFSIIGDYLYAIQHDGWNYEIYDLKQPTSPSKINTVNVGVHLETLFPYQQYLFIGSNTGMFIYDNTDPLNPVQVGMFEHARACDPVFVDGNYAYVTLWNGSECGGGPNQLDVIDISDMKNPVLKNSFTMQSPHGLSVKGNSLLLCEGDYGLKIFDNTDPLTVGNHQLDQIEGAHALDVISLPGERNVAMVIGKGGFYQYSFDDPADLKLLSFIPVTP
jgi:hypothetical protein